MLFLSWRKWPDLLIDFGRELYVPWQLNNGSMLGKDIFHVYGPLSDYFNSWLFKIFGTQLMTIAIFNIGLIAVLAYFIYRIFLITTDRLVATLTTATFLSVFAFSQYVGIANYNFVCPYSYEVTHGILLSFFSIYMLLIYLKRRIPALVGIIGLTLGLIFLTKLEIFIAISLAMSVGLLFILLADRVKIKEILRLFAIFCLGFLLPIIGFVVYFSVHMPFKEAIDLITLQYRVLINGSLTSSNIFYQRILGIDTSMTNISKLLITSGWYILILVIFCLLGYLVNRIKRKNIRNTIKSIILATFVFSAPILVKKVPWLDICRPLPVVMIVLITYFFIRFLRCRKNSQEMTRLLSLFVLTVFGFVLLLKMLLNTHVFHYGFALAMPATLLLAMLFLHQIPLLSKKLSGSANFVRVLGVVLVAIFILGHITVTKRIYSLKRYPVGLGGDTIMAFAPEISDMGVVMDDILSKIEELLKEDDTFVALPEGVMLNYLSRRKNPIPYLEFTPGLLEMFGEDTVLESFREDSPDYIILTHRDTSEFGYGYFGQDYGLKLFSWIRDNYRAVYLSGNIPLSGRGFGIIIAKRISEG